MSISNPVEALRAANDVEFIFLLCLRRYPYDFERWANLGVETAKLVVQNLPELHAVTTRQAALIDSNQDFTFSPEPDLIQRAFRVFLRRDPSADERARWLEQNAISATELIGDLLLSPEAMVVNGLEPNANKSECVLLQRTLAIANGMQHEAYCNVTIRNASAASRRLEKLHRLTGRSIVVGLHLFPLSDDDLSRLKSLLTESLNNTNISFTRLSADDVLRAGSLSDIDLLLTNNNFLYDRAAEQLQAIADARCVTACWLWDNHHQFDFSMKITHAFDIVFPAHSNGQIYLNASRALVASVVPCSTIQWGTQEAASLFAELAGGERTNGLYGRFNSYPGRIRLRDIFLSEASRQMEGNAITVADYRMNPWGGLSASDRFADLASRKAIICSPIYNDLPVRVFDALLAGAIPVIPLGLPDIGASFSFDEQRNLPIVRYIPNNLKSLRSATERAIQLFDEGGLTAATARHARVCHTDMLWHRITRMSIEAINIANQNPHS